MKKQKKPYWEMNAEELAEATKEFDREFVADSFRQPTPAERAKWLRAKRKPGRPRQGQGVQVISLSIEKGLLKKSDALANQLGISRAQLIATGLHGVLESIKSGSESGKIFGGKRKSSRRL